MQKVPDPRSGAEVTVYEVTNACKMQGLDLESVLAATDRPTLA